MLAQLLLTPGIVVKTVHALRNKGAGNDVNIPKGTKFKIVRDGGFYFDVAPVDAQKYTDSFFFLDPTDITPV